MVTDSPNDYSGATVSDTEPFACESVDICLSAGCTIEGDIAQNDILIGFKSGICRWIEDQLAAAKPLAEVVIGIAFDLKGNTAIDKSPKALATASGCFEIDRIIRQTILAVFSGHLR